MLTDWLFWGTGIALGVAGLGLLYWSLFRDRSRGRRRCPKCWYDMSGTEGLWCPECEGEVKSERMYLKTRRRWRFAAISLALMIAAISIAGRPLLQGQQWHGLVPTPVLIHLIGSFHSNWAIDVLTTRLGVMSEIQAADYEYGNVYRPIHEQYWGVPTHLVLEPMTSSRWDDLRQALLDIISESDDAALISKALIAIGTYGLIDQSCGDALVAVLDHPDQNVCRLAAAGLCYDSVHATLCDPDALKSLQPLVDSPDHYTRFVALRALSLCGLNDPDVRATFSVATASTDQSTRKYACGVLDQHCGSPALAFDLLSTMTDDPSEGVRTRVMRSMASLNSRGLNTLSPVMGFADDPSAVVRLSVVLSLVTDFRDEPRAIEHLLEFLSDDDEEVRWTLVDVVDDYLRDDDIATQILRPLTRDSSDFVRDDAMSLLTQIESKQ